MKMKQQKGREAGLEVKLGNRLDSKERLPFCLSEWVWYVLSCHSALIYVLCCRMQRQEVCRHRRNNRHSNRLSAFYCTGQDYAPLVHWEYFTWCQNDHTVTLQGNKKLLFLLTSNQLIVIVGEQQMSSSFRAAGFVYSGLVSGFPVFLTLSSSGWESKVCDTVDT